MHGTQSIKIFSLDIPLCTRVTDSFITPSVHNTQDDKIYILSSWVLCTDGVIKESVTLVHNGMSKLKILILCVPCILHIQHILPKNTHKTYELLKYKLHKNVIYVKIRVLSILY